MLHPVWELCSTALGVGPCRTYHALLALGHHKLLELTDVLGTSKQNVNNWLKKLRTAGLVEKVSDARWQAVEVDLDDIARNMDDSHMTEDGRVHQRTVLERPTARAQVFERLRVNVAQANLTGPPSVRHERTSRSLDELFKLPLEDAAARMQLETLRHELAIARQRLELEAALRLDAEHAAGWSA
jgi:DNA-binding transcriptional ArsR family regulator